MSYRRSAIVAAFVCFAGLFCLCGQSCSSEEAPANSPPEAADQSVSVTSDTPATITLTASDSDGGPGAMTYFIVSSPQHGTLTGTPPDVTYTPDTGYSGPDSFTFKANDGAADSNSATVSITVQSAGAGSTNQFQTYRGTFDLSWQWQRGGGSESAEASGTVEFGNPIDITQLYPEYAPGTAFSVTSANSPAQVSNWHSAEANGTTCTAAGPGTANVSWGWLYIRTSPNEHAIEFGVNGSALATCQPPNGPPVSYDRGVGAFFGGGGCAPKFVTSGPDNGKLEGTASWTCTNAVGTTTATLTWSLTGY